MAAPFRWKQESSTISVSFEVPPGTPKNSIDVSITSSSLVAGLKGQPPILSGTLFDHVNSSNCGWKLKGNTVTIQLEKHSRLQLWDSLFQPAEDPPAVTAVPVPSSPTAGTATAAGGASKLGIAPPRKVVRAAHDYTADDPLELSFREGDTIIVLAENASGWWKGELNGVVGLFPSNYTEEVAPAPVPYSEDVRDFEPDTAPPPAKPAAKPMGKQPAAAASFAASSMATSPASAKAKPPATSSSSATTSAAPLGGSFRAQKPMPAGAVPTPAAGPLKSAAPSFVRKPAPAAGTRARVLYNFQGQERGELSLQENDLITILEKDESGWWKGEVTYVGWFPSSYVQELSNDPNGL